MMDTTGRLASRNDPVRLITNPAKRTRDITDEYDVIENGNCFVDQLLEQLIGNMETGFDPHYLEDFILKMPFVKASLCNGYITGLQTLHRAGDCYLTKTFRRLHVAADISACNINIAYEVAINLKCLSLKFTVNLHFRHILVRVFFSIFSNSGRDADLYKFEIADLDDMVPSIAMYEPLDWLLNKVVRATLWFFNNSFKRLLSNVIKPRLQHRMSSYQFPVWIDKSLETIEESSETMRKFRDNEVSSESEEPMPDISMSGLIKSIETSFKENSPGPLILYVMDIFRYARAIRQKVQAEIAREEFRRPKPSYEILG